MLKKIAFLLIGTLLIVFGKDLLARGQFFMHLGPSWRRSYWDPWYDHYYGPPVGIGYNVIVEPKEVTAEDIAKREAYKQAKSLEEKIGKINREIKKIELSISKNQHLIEKKEKYRKRSSEDKQLRINEEIIELKNEIKNQKDRLKELEGDRKTVQDELSEYKT